MESIIMNIKQDWAGGKANLKKLKVVVGRHQGCKSNIEALSDVSYSYKCSIDSVNKLIEILGISDNNFFTSFDFNGQMIEIKLKVLFKMNSN